MKTALTIAGSDSSGGAGIQADIKTMTALKVYAMSAITALTAQNTMGVKSISEVSPSFLSDQLDCVFDDIFPDAIKTGMVSSSDLIHVIAEKLKEKKARHIVVDPVMVATSGAHLISEEAVKTLLDELIPLAEIITPNIPEAETLFEKQIVSEDDMAESAKSIGEKFGISVLVKGGHRKDNANDVLFSNGKILWFRKEKIKNPNTHGTGCTLSSAIASFLAKGEPLEKAVKDAKSYVSSCLSSRIDLGKGSGPLNHAVFINENLFSSREKE